MPRKGEFKTSVTVEPYLSGPLLGILDVQIGVHGGSLNGFINEASAYVDWIQVRPSLQGGGRGAHMIRAFAELALSRGVTTISTDLVSSGGVNAFARVFGFENIDFVENYQGRDVLLPMTIEQAQASADRYGQIYGQQPDETGVDYPGVHAIIDITSYTPQNVV